MGRKNLGPEYSVGYAVGKSFREREKLCFYISLSSYATSIKGILSVKKKPGSFIISSPFRGQLFAITI